MATKIWKAQFAVRASSKLCVCSFALRLDSLLSKAVFVFFLTRASALVTLTLRCNNISDVGACKIADALASNRSLTALNLWGNAITSLGAVHISKVEFGFHFYVFAWWLFCSG